MNFLYGLVIMIGIFVAIIVGFIMISSDNIQDSKTIQVEEKSELESFDSPSVNVGFVDHSVIVIPARGSGTQGCEESIDGCFHPSTMRIYVGGNIMFLNEDTTAHTFTAGTDADGLTGEFDSGLLTPGESFEYLPDTVGKIDYFCVVHPWMTGVINVFEN